MSGIFISYRRDDSAPYAGRLYDRLAKEFAKDHVFMDIDAIDPGEDFVEVINQRLDSCSAVVALIGKTWLGCVDETGARRLDNPDDYVRLELAAALAREVRVIPVLVGGAAMPRSDKLPDELVQLARRNAIEISDTRFHQDVDRLAQSLRKTFTLRQEPEMRRELRALGGKTAQPEQQTDQLARESQSAGPSATQTTLDTARSTPGIPAPEEKAKVLRSEDAVSHVSGAKHMAEPVPEAAGAGGADAEEAAESFESNAQVSLQVPQRQVRSRIGPLRTSVTPPPGAKQGRSVPAETTAAADGTRQWTTPTRPLLGKFWVSLGAANREQPRRAPSRVFAP
jgi:hypothetical protein